MSFTWKNGRQLATFTNSSGTVSYTYNADGVRIGKSGTKNITYEVSGTQILSEKNGTNTTYYLYDESGSPIGLTYKGTTYYYRKNLQGDVIAILNSSGTKIVTYTYNAWGKVISIIGNMELGVNNPFRYRGYYYDTESGLYYLNSRYYDPVTGRFINADGYVSTAQSSGGNNMFAYCGNDPVNCIDSCGAFWSGLWNIFKTTVRTVLHGVNNALTGMGIDTAAIGASLLDMESYGDGVYHAKFDCWQQYFGFNDFYDFMLDVGIGMTSAFFPFTYNGEIM